MAELKVDLEIDTTDAKKGAEASMKEGGQAAAASFAAGFKDNIKLITAAVIGVAAFSKSLDFFKSSIRAAATQQQAVTDLNNQLAITGQFTKEVSDDLQDFARNLQSVSRFGDEAILSQIAFAQAMGASAEQSKTVIQAGADLAESLNIDLNSAVRNVAKTLGGYAGELGEVIPELKALTQEQLRAGAGIDLIASKFAGAAQGRVKTFTGATAQLANTFGDFQEVLGRIVTNSPALISVINTTSDLIVKLTSNLSGLSDNDPFAEILLGALGLARTVNDFLIPPFRIFFGFINTGVNVAKTLIQGLISAIVTGADAVVSLGAKLPGALSAPFKAIADEVAQAKITTDEVLGDLVDETLSELVTEEQTENFRMRVDSILGDYQRAIEKSREFKGETINSFNQASKSITKTANSIGTSLNNTLGNAVASGIESITKSLIAGENVFKAFGQAALGLVADFAIQAGKLFVATGIAQLALFSSPGASIAAGAALIAAGTLAKSFFGGERGGNASAPAGIAGGGPLPTQPEFAPTTPEERAEPETRVSVTIQGDVFDSEETGLRISRILESASLNENVRVVGGIA